MIKFANTMEAESWCLLNGAGICSVIIGTKAYVWMPEHLGVVYAACNDLRGSRYVEWKLGGH